VSKRKELSKDSYDTPAIQEGDEQHPVWQAAYAAQFVWESNADHPDYTHRHPTHWHKKAITCADITYYMYKESVGVHKQTKKYPEGESYEWGTVEVVKETEKALKVKKPGGDDDDGEWVPKSQIHSKSEVMGDGDEGMLMVSQWFADQKNLTENGQAKEDKVPF
jgi:hypothetical protein